ncbi:DUF6907 domain-containing protein [Streptomyces nigra]|uniref:DUF6907 domain-containing protein n=1 Tax=Streptomyces nigra TaxID=1827580 RepID=UPI0037F9F5BB
MNAARTITLPTEDYGDVTLTEPAWCAGHADHRPDTYRVDLAHAGPVRRLTHNGALLWTVLLGQAPFATRPEHRGVGLYVAQEGYNGTLTPTAVYDLAAAFEAHADQLRDLADQLAELLGRGEGQ